MRPLEISCFAQVDKVRLELGRSVATMQTHLTDSDACWKTILQMHGRIANPKDVER